MVYKKHQNYFFYSHYDPWHGVLSLFYDASLKVAMSQDDTSLLYYTPVALILLICLGKEWKSLILQWRKLLSGYECRFCQQTSEERWHCYSVQILTSEYYPVKI